ncbi:ESX secretion-associated protein EspG, partial [Rhodococcus sp. (in: high G+C Gram-positive bacteria)]|uniref:ESX secretion-associated protein EspG n=1 Tax=Rhodococcus sp. TaxID=1831 RepID=UPI00257FDCC2
MTTMQWQFTGLEFQILWEAVGRDRLPYPLRFRPTAETMNELTEERRRAGAHLAWLLDDRLHHGLG